METPANNRNLFEQAARFAADYRDAVGHAVAALPYADMRAAFDMPIPQSGAPAAEVIDELVKRSTPGLRANYSPDYYAAFVIDPDGYRLEAHCSRSAA